MYISLRGKTYLNNSNILITNIGEGDSGAVLCHTDLEDCCRSDETNNSLPLGQWIYPDLSIVSISASNEDFFINRDTSLVRLNRRGNSTSPTGKFCCEIPDANYTLIKMCVNLGKFDSLFHKHMH